MMSHGGKGGGKLQGLLFWPKQSRRSRVDRLQQLHRHCLDLCVVVFDCVGGKAGSAGPEDG